MKLFNGIIENSLRLILLLSVCDSPRTVDYLYSLDFMTVYGKSFSITENDLNGDNVFKFSEFVSRRKVVQLAVNNLVRSGFASAMQSHNGFVFNITPKGREYVESLESDYSKEYIASARKAVESVKGKGEREVMSRIFKLSVVDLGDERG